ncbi:hypothetical protein N1851_000560 [Merluccius polli]|uniref:Uncharacterized protein n=1 Tax=Merluccius polli TaxID=89951 RepID=A0AA47NBV4_MERPO|nr:hypothetical protein N1851_000560 [Merluccius polli]
MAYDSKGLRPPVGSLLAYLPACLFISLPAIQQPSLPVTSICNHALCSATLHQSSASPYPSTFVCRTFPSSILLPWKS